MCVFIVTTYVKPWFTATQSTAAPRTDLQLLNDIKNYPYSEDISKIALKAFSNHLWYLSPYCVALAFFDPMVDEATKTNMVKNLSLPLAAMKPPQRANLNGEDDLATCVNAHTKYFFDALQIPTGFLDIPPSEWPSHADFEAALTVVKALHVVNDISERAVRLTSDFNRKLTTSEECFQNILLVRF